MHAVFYVLFLQQSFDKLELLSVAGDAYICIYAAALEHSYCAQEHMVSLVPHQLADSAKNRVSGVYAERLAGGFFRQELERFYPVVHQPRLAAAKRERPYPFKSVLRNDDDAMTKQKSYPACNGNGAARQNSAVFLPWSAMYGKHNHRHARHARGKAP